MLFRKIFFASNKETVTTILRLLSEDFWWNTSIDLVVNKNRVAFNLHKVLFKSRLNSLIIQKVGWFLRKRRFYFFLLMNFEIDYSRKQ